MNKITKSSAGFTVAELLVTIVVFGIVSASVYLLLMAHIGASAAVQLRTSALSLATERMEYLRSLPYDNLAVQGGSIVTGGTPLPGTVESVRVSRTFRVVTDIRYADDAFDGCFNYAPSQSYLCRNGPVNPAKPIDTNPRDYKVADVTVFDKSSGKQYATLSSQFTSRVAETAGNTSALSVSVFDSAGNAVGGASVRIRNLTTTPTVDQTVTTDTNGVALFLDVIPDNGADYVVEASKLGFSTLSTIAASGTLTPTYPNVNAITQQVSNVTLRIDEISSSSLEVRMVDINASPVGSTAFVIKGGIKLYTDLADTSYSYQQTITPDANGLAVIGSLVPGQYFICYDAQPNPCSPGHTRRLLVIRAAYGSTSHQPFSIPAGSSSAIDGGPMQRVILVTSTSATAPRISTISPVTFSTSASDASTSELQIIGANLAGATVTVRQGATTIAGTVVDIDTATSIKREFDLSSVNQGGYEVIVTTADGEVIQTGVSPGTQGGINVIP